MPNSRASTISWRRIVAEAAAIVLSILLAFSIDALWERRTLDEDLAAALAAVQAELEVNRDDLEFQLGVERRIVASADALADLLEAGLGSTVQVPDSLIAIGIFWVPTFDASTAAVESLVSSSRIDRVKDADLRVRLGAWTSRLDDVIEEQVSAREGASDRLWTPLLDVIDYRLALELADELWFAAVEGRSGVSHNLVSVPAERSVLNGLLLHRYFAEGAVSEMESLQRDLEHLLRSLSEETASL